MLDLNKLFTEARDFKREPHVLPPEDTGRRTNTVFVPDGYTEKVIQLSELENPLYVHQTVTTRRIADFLTYLNKYKNGDSIVVLAPAVSFKQPIATAIIDFAHPTVDGIYPNWGRHQVTYVPQVHPGYQLLQALDDQLIDQGEFSQYLKQLSRFITSMKREDLFELLRTFTIATKGTYKNFSDEVTGSVDFRYEVQVQGNAGTAERKISVPESFGFKVPVLFDGDPVDINAEFRYRAPKGGESVTMGIKMVDRSFEEALVLEALGDKIRAATDGLLTITGEVKDLYSKATG